MDPVLSYNAGVVIAGLAFFDEVEGTGTKFMTLGSKVIVTVGSKITDMTPSRAFAAQMGTVVALTSATLLALPVSTSECIVGSVIGVGLAKKVCGYEDAGLNLRVLRKIWAAWLLTIPYAGTIAALFFYFVQLLCRLSA